MLVGLFSPLGVIGFDSVCFCEVKRAEEGNDDLVNHPLQKIKCELQAH
jgi:hypothetical protein